MKNSGAGGRVTFWVFALMIAAVAGVF